MLKSATKFEHFSNIKGKVNSVQIVKLLVLIQSPIPYLKLKKEQKWRCKPNAPTNHQAKTRS